MAIVPGGNQNRIKITAAGQYELGDVNNGHVGTMCLQFVNASSFVGSILIKGRSRVPEAKSDSVPYVQVNYVKIQLNAAAGDQTYVNTAITDASLILVPSSGMALELDVTYTSGEMDVYVSRINGAAA